MKYAITPLIAAPFLFAWWRFETQGVELFWPFLILSALILMLRDWRAGAILAAGVALVQVPKGLVDENQLWVWWAGIYITLGLAAGLTFSIVGGITALIVGLLFLTYYAGMPVWVAHGETELAFILGACVAGYRGDGGGIIRAVSGTAPQPANGSASLGLVGIYRNRTAGLQASVDVRGKTAVLAAPDRK